MAFMVGVKDAGREKAGIQAFNLTMLCSLALLSLSAFNYGLSDQCFTSTQATDAFMRQFGDYHAKTKKYVLPTLFLSLLNSLKAGTQLVGVLVGSWISKRFGRRWCIFVMSIYALGSTSVIISATGRAQMLTGRSIHYIYLGMQLAVIPNFLAELAPAHLRGGMGVLYWLSIKCGGLFIVGIVKATSDNRGNSAWQIPVGLIYIIPVIVILLVWFTPESPRYLLLIGHQDAALTSFLRLRQSRSEKNASAPPSPAIESEFHDMSSTILALRESLQGISRLHHFLSIFSPANRHRTTLVVLLLFFQQSTGQAFASQYGTLFVKQLRTLNAFSVTVGTNAVDIGAILICMLLADRLGRKPVLVSSAVIQTAALMTMGGLGTADAGLMPAKVGIVAMLLLYSFGWSVGYAPLAYTVASELPSPYLREYTLCVGYTVKLIMEFVISFTYPYLEDADEANLGGKLGFIYGSLAFLAIIFSVFFVPETRNLGLEEMDEKFGKGLVGNNTEEIGRVGSGAESGSSSGSPIPVVEEDAERKH